jgi:PilZ domain-containing protein
VEPRGKGIIMGVSGSSTQRSWTAPADRTSLKPSDGMARASHRGEEHRRDPRIAVDDPGSMRIVNAESAYRSAVRILDVSKRGMKLWVPEFVHPGTTVQVRIKDLRVLGEVCFCVAASAGFNAGISIENVFERLLGQAHEDD